MKQIFYSSVKELRIRGKNDLKKMGYEILEEFQWIEAVIQNGKKAFCNAEEKDK